jgi:hypothetical protein
MCQIVPGPCWGGSFEKMKSLFVTVYRQKKMVIRVLTDFFSFHQLRQVRQFSPAEEWNCVVPLSLGQQSGGSGCQHSLDEHRGDIGHNSQHF